MIVDLKSGPITFSLKGLLTLYNDILPESFVISTKISKKPSEEYLRTYLPPSTAERSEVPARAGVLLLYFLLSRAQACPACHEPVEWSVDEGARQPTVEVPGRIYARIISSRRF